MKVVGRVVGDVGCESSYVVPGLLRAIRLRGRDAECVAWEESADVVLVGGCASQFVDAVAGIEVPPFGEVMIESQHSEVILLRYGHVALEALRVNSVASAA